MQDTAARVAALTGLPGFSQPGILRPANGGDAGARLATRWLLQRSLMERYGIEIPCFKWQDHTIVRVSAQGYNTQSQMDLLVTALTELLPRAISHRLNPRAPRADRPHGR